MENQDRIDSILRMMKTKLESYVEQESNVSDPIEYEDRLLKMGHDFAFEILRSSHGKLPKSRNQKKSPDQTGAS
jgi:hypothetical protein